MGNVNCRHTGVGTMNLFAEISAHLFATLVEAANVRIKRIVSHVAGKVLVQPTSTRVYRAAERCGQTLLRR